MGFVESLLLSLALCVDSLVVSATATLGGRLRRGKRWLMAAVFALCQGAIPLVGASVGAVSLPLVSSAGHWIAAALLFVVGGKMLVDALRGGEDSKPLQFDRIGVMFLLGVATSIDAFAVGIGLGLEIPFASVVRVCVLIGIVTLAASLLGGLLATVGKRIPARSAGIVAAVVLLLLAVKAALQL